MGTGGKHTFPLIRLLGPSWRLDGSNPHDHACTLINMPMNLTMCTLLLCRPQTLAQWSNGIVLQEHVMHVMRLHACSC